MTREAGQQSYQWNQLMSDTSNTVAKKDSVGFKMKRRNAVYGWLLLTTLPDTKSDTFTVLKTGGPTSTFRHF